MNVVGNRCQSRCASVGWLVFFGLAFCGGTLSADSSQYSSGSIGPGTPWETPWHIVTSSEAGPTVLIAAGIHGNEPAGWSAAEQIRHWPIIRGTLVVLPQVNRLGLAAKMRWAPAYRNDKSRRDLNRNFPGNNQPHAVTPLCEAIWDFVVAREPDWVFDLHEGFDFHRLNPKSVGSSVICFPEHAAFARTLQESVNVGVESRRAFDVLDRTGPVDGSLARACGLHLGAKSFILETTFKDQPLSLRTRQHRRMVSTALERIGLIAEDCSDVLAPAQSAYSLTRVAVFDDAGANETKVVRVLTNQPSLHVCQIGPDEMRPAVLRQFDVLVFPGGSGSKQGKAIGARGREHIRQFTSDGGGIVGICAGAYLCSSHYDWSLDLMNAAIFNQSIDIPEVGRKSMWYRGTATDVDVEISPEGAEVLSLRGLHRIRYQNGPILSPGKNAAAPAYTELAWFRTENGIYDAQKGTMIGTPAVVRSDYGKGRVLAISPHFESTPDKESVIIRAVEFVRRTHERIQSATP